MTIIKYYLIHGMDSSRKERMLSEFQHFGIDNNNVSWIVYPNKNDLSDDLIKSITTNESRSFLSKGQISCTYKHYLALQDFIGSDSEYGVIMEDNMAFYSNVPERVERYLYELNTYYPNWDIIFDLNYNLPSKQIQVIENRFVYPSNYLTRCAQFYLFNKKCAKKLYENYLPMETVSDHWMNRLFERHDIQSFWVEPPNVYTYPHISTV